MPSLIESVRKNLQSCGLFRPGQSFLVAVSGGVDSMTLLHVLVGLGKANQWRLAVAHLNHTLRGRSSSADACLVQATAQKYRLPYFGRVLDVKHHAKNQRISVEMSGRQLRHQLYAEAATEFGTNTIALGHHSDDQLELFFLRLFRGTGGEGLAGMKLLASLPGKPGLQLVRPLLSVSRAEISRYAGRHHIPFREDASNTDQGFLRNRIRQELLPLLQRRYQPAVATTIVRLVEIVSAEADLAKNLAVRWLSKRRRVFFEKLHLALQRRVISLQLIEKGIAPEFSWVEHLRTQPGRALSVRASSNSSRSQTLIARAEDGLLFAPTLASKAALNDSGLDLHLKARGSAIYGGRHFHWQKIKTRPPLRPLTPGVEHFDAEKVGTTIHLRKWRPGDRFQPIGMSRSVKVQDLFTNSKVPRAERQSRVVAETRQGEIFWIEGLRISELHKLTSNTRRFLRWEWQRA